MLRTVLLISSNTTSAQIQVLHYARQTDERRHIWSKLLAVGHPKDTLDVYELPYAPMRPVVSMDEKPYQLLGETKEPLLMRPGDDQKVDVDLHLNVPQI